MKNPFYPKFIYEINASPENILDELKSRTSEESGQNADFYSGEFESDTFTVYADTGTDSLNRGKVFNPVIQGKINGHNGKSTLHTEIKCRAFYGFLLLLNALALIFSFAVFHSWIYWIITALSGTAVISFLEHIKYRDAKEKIENIAESINIK